MKKTIGITTAIYLFVIFFNVIPSDYIPNGIFANVTRIAIFVAIFLVLGLFCTMLLSTLYKDDEKELFKRAARFGFPLPVAAFFLGQLGLIIRYYLNI